MIQREIRCCECSLSPDPSPKRKGRYAVGRGNEVDCPFCGVTLMIPDERRNMDDEQHRKFSNYRGSGGYCNQGGSSLETDYYDEDMEGADGYYGWD